MEFLKKVKVKNFARSVKKYGKNPYSSLQNDLVHYRQLEIEPNKETDKEYVVIGVTNIQEGFSDWLGSDEGYAWRQKKSHKVYIVSSGLGRRYKALEKDLEEINI